MLIPIRIHHNGKKYLNNCNDTVYGGDGIIQMFLCRLIQARSGKKLRKCLTTGNLNKLFIYIICNNKQQMDQYKSAADYAKRFNAADMWNGFVKYAGRIL